jgi:uncharacterized protein
MPTPSEWLLLALAESAARSLSPVQVQKTMFVFAREAERKLGKENFYDFVPYNYGPFDAAIYRDLADLERRGQVQIFNPTAGAARRYAITPVGILSASQIREQDETHASFLGEVVRWVEGKSFPDLIRAIYSSWPEYRQNSVFVEP